MIKVLTDTINYLTTTTLLSNIRGDKLSFDAHNMNDKTNILMSYSLLTKTTEIFQLCVMSLIMIIGNTWLVASRAVMLVTSQSPDTQHCQLFQYFTWFIAFLMGQDWAATLSLAFHYSLHSQADLVRLFATLFTLFWHTSLMGAGRLLNLLLLPFKLCRIAMWKVTPAHYKSFIVRFKYFNAKWVAWKGSIHFKDNTSQTIKQYHNSVAEIKFKSLINKMIKW